MAKKLVEMTVEEKLETLFKLQKALSEIDEKKALRGELPLEVQDLEDEIEGLNTRVDRINYEIDDFEHAITMKNGEMENARQKVEKYKADLGNVRNNREYDTLNKEIEFQQLEIELCAKKIREARVRIDERKAECNKTLNIIDERSKDLAVKREELAEIMQETREAEELLREQAQEYEAKIDPRLLASFKRIRKSARNGLGIVYVQRDACGGCFSKIPPQRQLDVKMRKKIIVCENCGRILIDPELAGVQVSSQAEEKPKRKRATGVSRRKKAEAEAAAAEQVAETE